MRQSIRGYADGVISQLPRLQLGVVAAELAGVREVVAGSDDLAGVLTDGGVPVASRRSVLSELFGSQVGAATGRLWSFVLDADRASDTLDDIAWLADRFDAASRDLASTGVAVLGLKAAEERVSGFASAVLEMVDDRQLLDEVEDELFRFQRTVNGTDALGEALSSRDLPTSVRAGIVSDLLGSKATPATTALASYATQVGRPRDYEALLTALIERVASESNRRIADVRSAVALDVAQRDRLASALSRSVGHHVEVRVTVDPTVVAGFVATIGDTVVDGSARRQLELLKERLASPEAAHLETDTATTGERH